MHELSGGERQRVALARALAPEPELVLLDEPFSNLDATLRAGLRREVELILRDAEATALLVTHDQEEALSLADRVAVMRDGQIVQVGPPVEVYGSPATRWAAQFVGEVNVLSGVARGSGVETELGVFDLRAPATGSVHVAVRPEQLELRADAERQRRGDRRASSAATTCSTACATRAARRCWCSCPRWSCTRWATASSFGRRGGARLPRWSIRVGRWSCGASPRSSRL